MMLPYSKQWIDDDDIAAVHKVLRSDWLTTGPNVDRFETVVAKSVVSQHAVAVSSGTAALHAMMHVMDIGPGDEVIVPALTFAATANCVVFCGGTPIFADIDRETMLIDPASVESHITKRTKAIIAVDYAGQPCDYDRLRAIADRHGIALLADACHSLGARYKGRPAGGLATMSAFSFHPVKPICSGEGGMVTTDDPALAERLRRFRNHGITTDHRQRQDQGVWHYEMVDLGFNYRLSDIHCALGISQMRKLECWVQRRQAIAQRYDDAFAWLGTVAPLAVGPNISHAYHLYVVRWLAGQSRINRNNAFQQLRAAGLGVNVHYIPVHLHPFYRNRFGTQPGMCPVSEAAYEEILSLPIFPRMSESEMHRVIGAVTKIALDSHHSTVESAA